ncbi:hypothetical protein [Piscinibacter defluvii]|uniref:hypothetical protein n=1 Tax=Piscinibacter defluvii TaxID=1796922 RepID=UPI000FDE2362|nr:hypothetical protein [Piscinibacter defluvii]
MAARRCVACGKSFRVLSQVPDQAYCSEAACQRERRKLWQRSRREADPDYGDNQSRAQQAWMERNPDYWRKYREAHPEYAERNRELQKQRNRDQRARKVAKKNASAMPPPMLPGVYRLTLASEEGVAKMDSWLVVLTFVTTD